MDSLTELKIAYLKLAYTSKAFHISTCLSSFDMLFHLARIVRSQNDLVISKGHAALSYYVILNSLDLLSTETLETYSTDGGTLRSLLDHYGPGDNITAGSLGNGLGVAVGMALARNCVGNTDPVFCLVGDGELNEGSCFEALALASTHSLNNLIIVVDGNELQALGLTRDIIKLDLKAYLSSLGFQVSIINGHSSRAITAALIEAMNNKNGPSVIVGKTQKGHPIPFMISSNEWHYRSLDADQLEESIRCLRGNHAI
jgi:transketolase